MRVLTGIISGLLLMGVVSCGENADQRLETDTDMSDLTVEDRDEIVQRTRPWGAAYVGADTVGEIGRILVDRNERPLYVFTADEGADSSTCMGDCAEVWPPKITQGNPKAIAEVVDSSLLGTEERDDGRMQATYDDQPLYYYAKDKEEDDIDGHFTQSYGGEWYLLRPSGDRVTEPAPSDLASN